MKKALAIILVLSLAVGYCALPLRSVSTITLTLVDQDGTPIETNAHARFRDAENRDIVDIALGRLPSWQNNIHWWAHSDHEASTLRPDDARRARSALVEAAGCAPVTLPIALAGTYVPPSPMPHGGGSAYMLYEFAATVRLECGAGG